jgi:hypothetical protein
VASVRRLVALLPVAAIALAPAVASAHRPATRAQRAAILAAVVRQHQLSSAQAACQEVTISTVNSTWAALTWPEHLSTACRKVAANGVIIEHYRAHAWHFADIGSDVGCTAGGMPAKVGRDLVPACAP